MKRTMYIRRGIMLLLMLFIVLYPILNIPLGIDMGESGWHLYLGKYLYTTPGVVPFTFYFTNVVIWLWLKICPLPAVVALCVLEVIVELAISAVVYTTFKKYLGEITTLVGLCIAMVTMNTYLNVFNYHQWNVFLMTFVLCMEFRAMTTHKVRYSVLAGGGAMVAIFSRMPSLTVAVTGLIYVLVWLIRRDSFRSWFRHMLGIAAGGCAVGLGMLVLLLSTHQLPYVLRSIAYLFHLGTGQTASDTVVAETTGGSYSFSSLIDGLLKGNLQSIMVGLLFFASGVLLYIGLRLILGKRSEVWWRVISVLIGLAAAGIAIWIAVSAFSIIRVNAWPQMSTGPVNITGILYIPAFGVMAAFLLKKIKEDAYFIMAVMGFALVLLVIAGSNTGVKHAVMGLWILAPLAVYVMRQLLTHPEFLKLIQPLSGNQEGKLNYLSWRIALSLLCLMFAGEVCVFVKHTNNFDSTDRSALKYTIDSDAVRGLKTTQREADNVNEVLARIRQIEDYEQRSLIVYGKSLMFYTLLDMKAYVRPWFTLDSYSCEEAQTHLQEAYAVEPYLPVVIYGRTDNYYGFDEDRYASLIRATKRLDDHGKKAMMLDFLKQHDYRIEMVNDYYCIFYPPDIATGEAVDFETYMGGEENEALTPITDLISVGQTVSVLLKWSLVEGADGYLIYAKEGEEGEVYCKAVTTKDVYLDTEVSDESYTHYWVAPYRLRPGGGTEVGAWSNRTFNKIRTDR